MAGDTKKPTFEAQHYTVMAVYDPDDERAVEGKYWHGTYRLYGAGGTDTPITSMGVSVSPALDLPNKEYLQALGEKFVPEAEKVSVLGQHVQKADGALYLELRTPGQNADAYRRLRTTVWMIKHVLNHTEDFALYLDIAAAGFVPDDDQVPDRWFPIPDQKLAIYDPDPEKDDPASVLRMREAWQGDEQEAGGGDRADQTAAAPAGQAQADRPALHDVDWGHIHLPDIS